MSTPIATDLAGLTPEELRDFTESLGEKPYRGSQIFGWIHRKGAMTFSEMTDVSQSFRDILEKKAVIQTLGLVKESRSGDGTVKCALRLRDGRVIESVLIPSETERERLTLCVSTQVGCPLDCKFCATGTMGFARNLTTGEIVGQYLYARRVASQRITNIVYMGMGEPMLNYENVMRSVALLTDERGAGIGIKHITISTAGYADKIRQMADEHRRVKLALSLHSLDEEKRSALMPITRKFGVRDLTDALRYYWEKTRQRPTLEYIPFDGFNDTEDDVRRLVAFSRKVPCKVNLIPFHPIDFTGPSGFAANLRPSPRIRIEWFAERLRDANVTVMVRSSSGVDINAACGQLAVTATPAPSDSTVALV